MVVLSIPVCVKILLSPGIQGLGASQTIQLNLKLILGYAHLRKHLVWDCLFISEQVKNVMRSKTILFTQFLPNDVSFGDNDGKVFHLDIDRS